MPLLLTAYVLASWMQPMALIQGYMYGLTLVLLFGPVFFTLLQSTLESGFRGGFSVALGIFSGDALCLALLFGLGVTDFFLNPSHQFWIGLIGAGVLLYMGMAYFRKKPRLSVSKIRMPSKGYFPFFLKGFVVNFFNPSLFAIWIAFIALAARLYSNTTEQGIFLAGALLAILTTDTLKAALAHSIQPILTPKWLRMIFRGTGLILAACGLYILVYIF